MKRILIAIRHGIPEAEGYPGFSCHLSAEGKKQARTLARSIQVQGFSPGQIFCSPLKRALETAEILSEELHLPYPIEKECLGYMFSSSEILNALNASDASQVLLVGHAPSLGGFVNALAGQTVVFGLKKGEGAILEFEAPEMEEGSATFVGTIT